MNEYGQNQNIMIHCGSNNWTPCSFEFWIRRLDLLPYEFQNLNSTHFLQSTSLIWTKSKYAIIKAVMFNQIKRWMTRMETTYLLKRPRLNQLKSNLKNSPHPQKLRGKVHCDSSSSRRTSWCGNNALPMRVIKRLKTKQIGNWICWDLSLVCLNSNRMHPHQKPPTETYCKSNRQISQKLSQLSCLKVVKMSSMPWSRSLSHQFLTKSSWIMTRHSDLKKRFQLGQKKRRSSMPRSTAVI